MDDAPEDDGTDDTPGSPEMQMIGVAEILQSIEDALVENGWEDFRVRTQHGLWVWLKKETASEPG
jgi:hypothetical protein